MKKVSAFLCFMSLAYVFVLFLLLARYVPNVAKRSITGCALAQALC